MVSLLRRLAAALFLASLAALLVWRSGSGSESLHYYNPDEYVARADAFIRSGYLRAECMGDQPRIEEVNLQNATETEQSWYGASYLSTDVERFNADPSSFGWAFVIDDDCRLRGVNPSVHRIELPFAERIRWLGSLFYRGTGSQAMLRSAQRTITLRSPDKPVPARQEARTRVGGLEDVAEQGVVLLHFAGGPGQPAARLFPVGRETVMSNRVLRNQPHTVRLLGHQLPLGRMARFESGDWLQLEAPRDAETFVYVGATALTSASRMRLANDRYERTTDDPNLGLVAPQGRDEPSPYLDLVADSLDNALAALPEDRARELARGFDVQLTLERGTQLRLSQAFRRAVGAVQEMHPGLPFGAGMTVLDGKSGDVLAMATYPLAEDLKPLRVEDEKERRRLLRNQNLLLHPIGSSGKPFFFAAIADAFPFLMDTVIAPYDLSLDQREILQCELRKGYRVPSGSPGPVDFRTALQISSNRYAIELATLALAAGGGQRGGNTLETLLPPDPEVRWPLAGQSSGIVIGGRPLDYAPRLEVVHRGEGAPAARRRDGSARSAAERCRTIDSFEQVRFREPFERLTGTATYWGTSPQSLPDDLSVGRLNSAYRTGRYDLRLFKPLLAHLFTGVDDDRRWKIRTAVQEMSPERVNLAFNQVTRMREDYVTLLLGGGNSIWTNVQLAEAMSRLVTGREVEARLAARVLPRQGGETAPPPELPRPLARPLRIRPEARTAVLEGIQRVGRLGGTAAPMAPAIDRHLRPLFPGDQIDLFSKTGSPVVERPVPAAMARALDRLVSRSRLAVEGRTLVVRTRDGNVPQRGPEERGRQEYRRAIASALSETGLRNVSPWLVSHLADTLDEFAADLRAGGADTAEGPIAASNGIIRLNREDRLFRQRLVPGTGAVYVFSLVRRPGGGAAIPTPADFSDPRTKVVTVAIFLAVGPDSKIAVEVATRVVPELGTLLM